jgi:hypothetical protein
LLIISIDMQFDALVLMIDVHPDVDRVATYPAITVKLLITCT